ncbi:MAG TPA: NAD(+) synthase [Spongiibacteraceae bacterium]|nr:NAD(+) synthase [Spongiibacteraceae bacterium]
MKQSSAESYFNLYTHGFVRVAVAIPHCRIADPAANAALIIEQATAAAAQGAAIVAFPELGLTAYTCDDLFHQQALLDAAIAALESIVKVSEKLPLALIVGLPLRVEQRLFNCAAVIAAGRIHGVVPKSYLPNYGEFYEARQFSPASHATVDELALLGQRVPFGPGLLFDIANLPLCKFHVEICEDLWVPIPPSSFAALAGATLLVNLSASNIVIGKSAYRRQLVAQQSARCFAAYLYASAGAGESTTDMAWDGQSLICENGELLAESERFTGDAHLIFADIDLQKLAHERMRTTTFGASMERHIDEVKRFKTIAFSLDISRRKALPLQRALERFPYVPANREQRDIRCSEVYHIQVQALAQRLSATGMKKVVIGVSGGLDSTHALLVCAQAMDRLQLPRANIIAVTMPGFATSERTLEQARQLMQLIGCEAREIDIRPSCLQMLEDINHPYSEGEQHYDVTFENVQAGERTSHLFRLANLHHAIVIGTGDLSELALGWCTYGVGDHMSHYSVNASVPKTLISHLVRWVAETHQIGVIGSDVLLRILDTAISPELVPGDSNSHPEQKTEDVIGPYELHDFYLYYTLRFGFMPSKVAFLAHSAWSDKNAGRWPEESHVARNEYDLAAIKKHLRTFLYRFFKTSQFKRSCVPNAPKVGSGGSLSPRGDWRAPSDADATVWLQEWENIPG